MQQKINHALRLLSKIAIFDNNNGFIRSRRVQERSLLSILAIFDTKKLLSQIHFQDSLKTNFLAKKFQIPYKNVNNGLI